MSTYTFVTHIAAPREAVFALWSDIDRIGEWVEGVTKVTDVRGAFGDEGTTYTLWFGRMRSPTRILEADRPRHIRTEFGHRLLRGESEVTFEPADAGTRLIQVFRVSGLISNVAARVFATGDYRGSFRGELKTFAHIAAREERERRA